jgi:hypothetical protein
MQCGTVWRMVRHIVPHPDFVTASQCNWGTPIDEEFFMIPSWIDHVTE